MTTQELLPIVAELQQEFLNEEITGLCKRAEEQH